MKMASLNNSNDFPFLSAIGCSRHEPELWPVCQYVNKWHTYIPAAGDGWTVECRLDPIFDDQSLQNKARNDERLGGEDFLKWFSVY